MKAHENPFASHIISAIDYRFAERDGLHLLLQRLEASDWRGAIVGPHGSGKTTLIRAIHEELLGRGFDVFAVELRSDEPKARIAFAANSIVIIDGAEQIDALRWWLLMRRAKHSSVRGVIITTHRPQKLATIFETRPSARLFTELVNELASDPVAPEELNAVYARHSGNIREALREMYDRFSRRSFVKNQ